MRIRRRWSCCSSISWRRSKIVVPRNRGTPDVIRRSGSPPAWASIVVSTCRCLSADIVIPPLGNSAARMKEVQDRRLAEAPARSRRSCHDTVAGSCNYYLHGCPRGSHINARRMSSCCPSISCRRSRIVAPRNGGTPEVISRNGSPPACASIVVSVRRCLIVVTA
jgi:hypothetical protein